ncbi:hypothetical protein [Saccharothrix hoggarensis]|uniref:Uncharacterized protein n=1 Tax=Saccharothrix hoggarensis TaxID=913853 RepID=A0ABW3QRE8_9PSEU
MPEPLLVSVAAAIASRAVAGLYELVRARFADDPAATATLTAAEGAAEGSPRVAALGAALEQVTEVDPGFRAALLSRLEASRTGRVTNQITATTVRGNVLQAGDVQGGVNFT